ncbi:hypothetical protein EYC80_008142 [Monilinia laxa]|uniref:Uncharacterized protein n=1 Tax=Monilinia laxa TaxID=61186 RepID=A0A5N6JTL3_MONLA|nr:hypothetical protein EYC80_008142 [Monilinia laxa]
MYNLMNNLSSMVNSKASRSLTPFTNTRFSIRAFSSKLLKLFILSLLHTIFFIPLQPFSTLLTLFLASIHQIRSRFFIPSNPS